MKPGKIFIALVFLLIPIAIRLLWFYQGIYQPSPINIPDYASLKMPLPEISTPGPKNQITGNPQQTIRPLVLIDAIHDNLFSLSEIGSLTSRIAYRGSEFRLTTTGSLEEQLKEAVSFIIIAPTKPYDLWEIQTLTRFVERGGHVLVITDPTRNYNYSNLEYNTETSTQPPSSLSVDVANQVLEPFMVSISDDYLYNLSENEGNFRNIIFTNFGPGNITVGLSKVVFYSAHSIKTNQSPLIYAGNSTLSSFTDQGGGLPVVAGAAKDRVIVVGDMTFLTAPYNQVADNSILINNISDFLTFNEKVHDLHDYPYLFNKPVTIMVGEEITVDKSFLDDLNVFSAYLIGPKLPVKINNKPVTGEDLFIFETYPPSKEFLPFIEELGVSFYSDTVEQMKEQNNLPGPTPTALPTEVVLPENESLKNHKGNINSLDVPGLGLLDAGEVGIILFTSHEGVNALTLLADSPENIRVLSKIVSSGISQCNILGNIAVCTLEKNTDRETGSSKSNPNEGSYNFESESWSAEELGVPSPTPTPSPSGPVGGITWLTPKAP